MKDVEIYFEVLGSFDLAPDIKFDKEEDSKYIKIIKTLEVEVDFCVSETVKEVHSVVEKSSGNIFSDKDYNLVRGNVKLPKGDMLTRVLTKSGKLKYPTFSLAELLLSFRVDPNLTDNFGETALMQACSLSLVEVVNFLIRNGATIDDQNLRGSTALMKVAGIKSSNALQISQTLLEAGADANISNNFGRTALHIAAFTGNKETLKLLLSHGANIVHADKVNATPLSYSQPEKCYVSELAVTTYDLEISKLLSAA